VAELAWVDFAEVSRAVRLLERKGYLVRKANPADRRTSIVCLTEAGKGHCRETMVSRSRFHEQLLRGLSSDERVLLDDMLLRIGVKLKDILKNRLPEK